MIRNSMTLKIAALGLSAAVAACGPIRTENTVKIEQDKPIEINVHARIDVVISDARKDMEQITGEKPTRTLSAADLGLDAATTGPQSSLPVAPALPIWQGELGMKPIVMLADFGAPRAVQLAEADRQTQLKEAMKQRHDQVRALLDTQNAGEAHTGLLEKRAAVTAAQQKLMDDENADRGELYKLEAQAKGTPVETVIQGYYVARLEHAKAGDWYEKFNKAKNAWEWLQFKD